MIRIESIDLRALREYCNAIITGWYYIKLICMLTNFYTVSISSL